MPQQTVDFEQIRTVLDRGYENVRNSPWYTDAVYDKFSDAEYQRRWRLTREKMARLGLDVLIAGGGPAHWSFGGGMMWLSGHWWEWHAMAVYVVFPREGEPILIYGGGGTHAEAVRRMASMEVWGTRGRFMQTAVQRIKDLGLERGTIGLSVIDPAFGDYLPVNQYHDLREGLPHARIEFVGDFFHDLVVVKSPEEQERVARAGELCADALRAMAERAAPGVAEYELAAAAGGAMLKGNGRIDFLIIGSTPMADPNIVFGNPRPSGRKLQKGDIVVMELAAGYYGYTAQIGSPITIGEPTPEVRRFFDEVILPGFLEMEKTLRPGKRLSDTYEAGKFFRRKGYQSRPIHLHGLDFTSHAPFVGTTPPDPDLEWKPGMAVVLEPNPITPDGRLGIFFGHTYIITEGAPRRVTPYPLELTVV